MSEKQRADVALVERGLCESRTKAQVSIMAGEVYVGTRRIDKASELIKPEDELEVGQVVEAKIIDINDEKKKVSLSIRALLEDGEDYED